MNGVLVSRPARLRGGVSVRVGIFSPEMPGAGCFQVVSLDWENWAFSGTSQSSGRDRSAGPVDHVGRPVDASSLPGGAPSFEISFSVESLEFYG